MKKYEEQYWRSYERHQRERDKLTMREDRDELIRFGLIMACLLILALSIISANADKIAQAVLHYERPALAVVTAADVEPLPVDAAEITYYYDVPLAADLQDYIYTCCEQYGLWPELVLAVIEVESSYNANAYNGGCYGLMQIHEVNHPRWMDELGVTDFYDPKDNIQAGCYMLSELLVEYGEVHAALMAYNCGERRAAELWDSGIYTTAYSRKVVEIMQRLEAAR